MSQKLRLPIGNAASISLLVFCLLGFGLNASPAPGEPYITGIEVNQALGNQYNNHRYFVAGKNTVIRALMSEPIVVGRSASRTDTQAVVKIGGKVVAVLSAKPGSEPTGTVDFLCPSMKECGDWAPGTYDFDVTVKGSTMSAQGYVFQQRRTLKILAVPMKTNYGGKEIAYPNQKWKNHWTFTRDVYPIAADSINWVQREVLDLSDGSKYDLNTDDGQLAVWRALRNLNPTHCPPVGKTPKSDCYDLIVGFMPRNVPDASGFTMGKPASVVTGTDPDAAATVSHECAHLFLIGDTYKGGDFNCGVNPAPDGWNGKDWNNPDKTVSCTRGAVGFETIGTKIFADSHPYDVNGRGRLGDKADYMGHSGDADEFWTTPETYDWLFTQFAPGAAAPRPATQTSQRLIAYSGMIRASDNKVTLEPWKSYADTVDITDTTGTFTIEALDQAGNVLATQGLDVNFSQLSDPPRKLPVAPFQGTMRFPSGTAKFRIVTGDTVLSERTVNPDPPEVGNVTPTSAGVNLSGIHNITWSYNDVHGSGLTYEVAYNPDITNAASNWDVLASGLTQNKWKEDFDLLPGGTNAQIRVTATDGVNATAAFSQIFSVPPKPPEITINPLKWGHDYETGDEVLLSAEAYDLQDEELPDDNIVWSSNINGVLGKGAILVVANLAPGRHVITATATDRLGMVAIDLTNLTVSSCAFTIDKTTLSFHSGMASASVNVSASQSTGSRAVCSLTNNDVSIKTDDGGKWLSAGVEPAGPNKWNLFVSVLANGAKYARTGSILVRGDRIDVTQAGQ
jgi:hypothetical protein